MMAEVKQKNQQYIPWTPTEGFDLSFLTIKQVAHVAGVSSKGVKHNVEGLLPLLPINERVVVLEHMLKPKGKNSKLKVRD